MIVTKEDLARFCFPRRSWTSVVVRACSSLSMTTTYILSRFGKLTSFIDPEDGDLVAIVVVELDEGHDEI